MNIYHEANMRVKNCRV